MKIITIKKKRILKVIIAIVFIYTVGTVKTSFGMQHYYKLDFVTGLVNATKLNVRSGPSTKYPVVTTVNKNEYIRVFAGIGNWYIIQTNDDHVGAVSKEYIRAIYQENTNSNIR